jgi:hypothetical protein
MKEEEVNIKDVVMNGNIATISHCVAGKIYYEVKTEKATYHFPVDMNDKEDVGTTTFPSVIKAITLMRYLRKAIKNEELVIY